jgi:hypothetical protein
MTRTVAQPINQFSFDHMVSEVNAIVEDLRWLHLELTLRNRCNEVMFQRVASEDEVFALAFEDLRKKLDALELTVYIRHKNSSRVGFRDMEESVPWAEDAMPWLAPIARWFNQPPRDTLLPKPEVSHFTVNTVPITAVMMPIVIGRDNVAVILIVSHSSSNTPRLRKLLAGLSGSLGLAIDYIRKARRSLDADAEETRRVAGHAPDATNETLASLHAALVDRVPGLAFVLDRHLNVVGAGEAFLLSAGRTSAELGFPVDELLPRSERGVARQLLTAAFEQPGEELRLPLIPPGQDDGSFSGRWWTAPLRDPGGDEDLLLLFAAGLLHREERAAPLPTAAPAPDFRLSKQYRFMIKYVPFPVVHIDDTRDVIRNANPAFEGLIGTRNWEGIPLSDFASLAVHEAFGDTAPCTLAVIGPTGISLSYRGIITPLMIFGKMVREIKLDPLDLNSDGVSP